MSTNYKSSAAARRRKQRVIMRRRIICGVVAAGLCAGVVLSLNHFHQKSVQDLRDEVNGLTYQVLELTSENQGLSAALQKSNDRLSLFVDGPEVRAASIHIYNIPLSKELQEYTYSMCEYYLIPEHYELVLAMMWQESHFKADLVSSTNDYGIMQINKCNHEWLSEQLGINNYMDAKQNIEAGTYLISKLLLKYEDENKALMAYNMGETGARNVWSAGNYTSSYSRDVVAKREAIEADNYNAD